MIVIITNELTPDVINQTSKILQNSVETQRETAGFLIDGLNIENDAFQLHQKVIALFFDKVLI